MFGKCSTGSRASRAGVPKELGRLPAGNQSANKIHLGFTLAANGDDRRPYLGISIYGSRFLGLLDSGASRTIIGRDGWKVLEGLGLSLKNDTVHSMTLADGTGVGVLGIISLLLCSRG